MPTEDLDIIFEVTRLNEEGIEYSQILRNVFQKFGPQSPPRMAYIFRMALGPERFETHDFVPAFASWWPDNSEISDEEFDRRIRVVFEEFPPK